MKRVEKFFSFNLAQFHLPRPLGLDPVVLIMHVDWPIIPVNTLPYFLIPRSSCLFCKSIDTDFLFFSSLSLIEKALSVRLKLIYVSVKYTVSV